MRFGLFLMVAAFVNPAVADQATAELYVAEMKRACSEEWGTNYRMVEFCQERQFDAMSAVKRILEETDGDAARTQIIQTCIQEWPEGKGYNWRMAEFCYERQIESFNRLNQ